MNIIDLLFPKFCIYCQKPGSYVCCSCFSKWKSSTFQECIYCNNLTIDGHTHKYCLNSNLNPLKKHIFTFEYDELARDFFIQAKGTYNAFSLFEEILQSPLTKDSINLIRKGNIDLITYIPMTPKLSSYRIYDHSEFIAEIISKQINKPVMKMFKKSIFSKSQKNKSLQNRSSQSDLFAISNLQIQNKNILLIDDICTSGNSLINAGKLLATYKTKDIHAYTLFKRLKN